MATRRDEARRGELDARRVNLMLNSLASFISLRALPRVVARLDSCQLARLASQRGKASLPRRNVLITQISR